MNDDNNKILYDGRSNAQKTEIDEIDIYEDLFIAPEHVMRYIRINFIATKSNVSFSEIVGKWET